MWLASLSRHNLDAKDMDAGELALAEKHLLHVLGAVGDPTRWRTFRMCTTVCLHKVALPGEVERAFGTADPGHSPFLAGSPVAILHESEPAPPSARPCANLRLETHWYGGKPIRLPADCGECLSCAARRLFEDAHSCPTCAHRKP